MASFLLFTNTMCFLCTVPEISPLPGLLPGEAACFAAEDAAAGAGIGDGHGLAALTAYEDAVHFFRRDVLLMLPVHALAPAGAEPAPFVAWIGHRHGLSAARAEEAPQDGRAFRPGPVFAGLFPVRFLPAPRRAVPLGASVREEALPAHRANRFPLHGAPAGSGARKKDSSKKAVFSLWQKRASPRAVWLVTYRKESVLPLLHPPVRKSDGRSSTALFAQRVLQFTVSTSF